MVRFHKGGKRFYKVSLIKKMKFSKTIFKLNPLKESLPHGNYRQVSLKFHFSPKFTVACFESKPMTMDWPFCQQYASVRFLGEPPLKSLDSVL